MRRLVRLTSIGSLVCASCGAPSSPAKVVPAPSAASTPRPGRYQVRLLGALIAPSKTDGRVWDGSGLIAQTLRSGLTTAIGGGVGAVLSFAGQYKSAGEGVPDPEGYAELEVRGVTRRLVLKERVDTFAATWDGIVWDPIEIDETVRVRVRLWDNDKGVIKNEPNDDIGTAVVGSKELLAIAAAQKGVHVGVWDQTANQLLTVQLEVVPVP